MELSLNETIIACFPSAVTCKTSSYEILSLYTISCTRCDTIQESWKLFNFCHLCMALSARVSLTNKCATHCNYQPLSAWGHFFLAVYDFPIFWHFSSKKDIHMKRQLHGQFLVPVEVAWETYISRCIDCPLFIWIFPFFAGIRTCRASSLIC